jgi:hypothetical protein
MNLAELSQKLISAARANPPSEQVPYAFEQRIIARLRARPVLDYWGQWAGALWRATVPCLAVMMLLSVWSYFVPTSTPASSDLSQEIVNTMLAAADQETPAESFE